MIEGSHSRSLLVRAVLDDECRPKMLICTVEHAANAPAERPISCIMIAASVTPSPAPAELDRHGDAEPAAFRDRGGEFEREECVRSFSDQ